MKKLLPAILVVILVAVFAQSRLKHGDQTDAPAESSAVSTRSAAPARSESEPRAGSQFEGEGTVARVLPDDNEGSRHQRFIVRLSSGRTVLIAHNIDLAPRVAGLSAGDSVSFSGEFEDNDRGGVVHWTHHDPNGRHRSGWIRHNGQTYQ